MGQNDRATTVVGTARGRAAAAVAAATLAALALQPARAAAVPGNPGRPSPPSVVLHETFETDLAPGEVVTLPEYRSGVYTAGAYWLNTGQCNGIVVGGNSSDGDLSDAGCSEGQAQDNLRAYATRLGQLNGTTPDEHNHAVSAFTRSQDSPGDRLLFRTAVPVPLASGITGRFLTGAVSAAATACHAAQPRLRFYLETPGAEQDDPPVRTALSEGRLNPCAFEAVDGVNGGRLIGDRSVLYTGSTFQFLIENETTSGAGNDFGFDDVQILDVSPQLDKEFRLRAGGITVGGVVDLVFTVTNTSELGQKAGWSFVDHLPEGLRVASGTGSGDAADGACDATVTAVAGSTEISVTEGVLDEGETSCTLTVPVVVERAGNFVNGPDQVSANGLVPPAAATLAVAAPAVSTTVAPAPTTTTPQLPMTGGSSGTVAFGLGVLALAAVAVRRRLLHGVDGR